MHEDSELFKRFRETEARIAAAVETRDPSQLRSADEQCSYSWALAKLGEWDQAEAAARAITDDEDERCGIRYRTYSTYWIYWT